MNGKWYHNFANLLALIAIPCGIALMIWGPPEHQEKGWIILAYAFGVGSVPIGNKLPPKGTVKLLSLLLILSLIVGCITPQIPPNTGGIMKDVYERHDAYVIKAYEGGAISKLQMETFLEDTNILRCYLEQNSPNTE